MSATLTKPSTHLDFAPALDGSELFFSLVDRVALRGCRTVDDARIGFEEECALEPRGIPNKNAWLQGVIAWVVGCGWIDILREIPGISQLVIQDPGYWFYATNRGGRKTFGLPTLRTARVTALVQKVKEAGRPEKWNLHTGAMEGPELWTPGFEWTPLIGVPSMLTGHNLSAQMCVSHDVIPPAIEVWFYVL